MVNGISKKIVVIKNIPSNVIEEAILILKNEPENAVGNNAKPDSSKKKAKWKNEYLLKEAEDIISEYIKQNNVKGVEAFGNEKHPKLRRKKGFLTNVVINSVLTGSILLLFYILTRIV